MTGEGRTGKIVTMDDVDADSFSSSGAGHCCTNLGNMYLIRHLFSLSLSLCSFFTSLLFCRFLKLSSRIQDFFATKKLAGLRELISWFKRNRRERKKIPVW